MLLVRLTKLLYCVVEQDMLYCVFELDTLSAAKYWFNPGRQEIVPK